MCIFWIFMLGKQHLHALVKHEDHSVLDCTYHPFLVWVINESGHPLLEHTEGFMQLFFLPSSILIAVLSVFTLSTANLKFVAPIQSDPLWSVHHIAIQLLSCITLIHFPKATCTISNWISGGLGNICKRPGDTFCCTPFITAWVTFQDAPVLSMTLAL